MLEGMLIATKECCDKSAFFSLKTLDYAHFETCDLLNKLEKNNLKTHCNKRIHVRFMARRCNTRYSFHRCWRVLCTRARACVCVRVCVFSFDVGISREDFVPVWHDIYLRIILLLLDFVVDGGDVGNGTRNRKRGPCHARPCEAKTYFWQRKSI